MLDGKPGRDPNWGIFRPSSKRVEAAVGNHALRAVGTTDYIDNGGDITIAQRMARHANIKTTQVCDEIERVGI